MTYEIYRYISLGGAILAGIMLVVSIVVFFLLKIPGVIGDLTGITARKAIENIRNQNESSGDKESMTSLVNRERGRLTDKISASGRLIRYATHSLRGDIGTAKIGTQRLNNQGTSEATTVLSGELGGSSETTVLSGELGNTSETTVLDSNEFVSETTVLDIQDYSEAFVIEREITYIHTDEVIF